MGLGDAAKEIATLESLIREMKDSPDIQGVLTVKDLRIEVKSEVVAKMLRGHLKLRADDFQKAIQEFISSK